jgi:hypothetical protein
LAAASAAQAQTVHHIELNCNFNGIVHSGEDGFPDAPAGFRSISDRALDFVFGVPGNPVLDNYVCVDEPGVMDIVYLGNRNTVDYHGSGGAAFDLEPDGDEIGIQPTWLSDPNQMGEQTTTLANPILLDSASSAGVIFQISNGGGSFDVAFRFQGGGSHTATLTGPDWFGPFNGQPNIGQFPGRGLVDLADFSDNLLLTEGTVDLSAFAGETLTEIGVLNQTNIFAGYAVIAMNVTTGSGGGFALSAQTSCPSSGPARLQASGGSGGRVAFVYSTRTGSFRIPNNQPCAGTTLGLGGTPALGGTAQGNPATLNISNVPGGACGHIFVQAVDLDTCATSNVVRFE